MSALPERHLDDATFHLLNASRSLRRARKDAETPAQHALLWKLEQRASELRDSSHAVVVRLRHLRRAS
jgi:hypothetical protein